MSLQAWFLRRVDNNPNFVATDAHGQSLSPGQGKRGSEIYDNIIYQSLGNTGFSGIGVNGRDGVIFSNDIINMICPIKLAVENSAQCPSLTYPVPDQPRRVYLWDNMPNSVSAGGPYNCGNLLQQNRDYFIAIQPGYTPYSYPYPGRMDLNGN